MQSQLLYFDDERAAALRLAEASVRQALPEAFARIGGELAYRVRGIKGAIVFPVLLPGLLDLVRQLRGIAVRSGIALGSHNHTV